MMRNSILAVAALAAMTLTGAAEAATTISLTGNIADFSFSQSDWGGLHFDQFYLPLSGLNAGNALTVNVGDTINTTVTLDQAYTIPGSVVRTDLLLFLTGSGFPAGDTGVQGTIAFYSGGNLAVSLPYSSTTSDQLASFGVLFPPSNTAFTFDSFTVDATINKLAGSALGGPATIDGASFDYALVSNSAVSAAPEAANWLMLLVGLGTIGMALRAKTGRQVLAG